MVFRKYIIKKNWLTILQKGSEEIGYLNFEYKGFLSPSYWMRDKKLVIYNNGVPINIENDVVSGLENFLNKFNLDFEIEKRDYEEIKNLVVFDDEFLDNSKIVKNLESKRMRKRDHHATIILTNDRLKGIWGYGVDGGLSIITYQKIRQNVMKTLAEHEIRHVFGYMQHCNEDKDLAIYQGERTVIPLIKYCIMTHSLNSEESCVRCNSAIKGLLKGYDKKFNELFGESIFKK